MLPRPPRSTLFPYTRSSDLEDTAVGAAPHEEAAAPLRLRGLDAQGVVAAREVDVAPATLVVVVKARDVRPHAVHDRQLEGRRRGRQADAHPREPPAALPEEPREERCRAVIEPLLEHGAREAVDLHDHEAAYRRRVRRAAAASPHEPVEQALEAEDEVVEGHRPLL